MPTPRKKKFSDAPVALVKPEYGDPIPTKFTSLQEAFLNKASHDTNFSRSDLIRRAVILLRRQKTMCRGYSFLLDLTDDEESQRAA